MLEDEIPPGKVRLFHEKARYQIFAVVKEMDPFARSGDLDRKKINQTRNTNVERESTLEKRYLPCFQHTKNHENADTRGHQRQPHRHPGNLAED